MRTLANALAVDHEVDIFAHRIQSSTDWIGPFDREAPFSPITDPESGVVTRQLRMTCWDLAAATPLLAVLALVPADSRRRLVGELWHAQVAGRRFGEQFGAPELVHRFGGNRMSVAAVVAARRRRAPIVITPNAHPGQWDDDWLSALAYRSADLVVATCAADAQTYLRLGVDPSRLETCGIASRGVVIGGGELLRRERGIRGPLVLFVGVRRAYKGIDELLGAARILAAGSEARVAFVGPGDPLPPDSPPNVLDVGEVDIDQRDAWFDAADVVCLPSSNESWGLTVSEAWSAGVPVVTSDIPVLRERVEGAAAGFAVPADSATLAAAIGQLLSDPDTRARMGEAGRREWENSLTATAIARRHLEIYAHARSLYHERPVSRLNLREARLTKTGG